MSIHLPGGLILPVSLTLMLVLNLLLRGLLRGLGHKKNSEIRRKTLSPNSVHSGIAFISQQRD